MADTPTPTAESETDSTPKRSRRKLFIIAGALIILLGGGGAAAYYMRGGNAEAAPAAAEPVKAGPGSIVELEPFVVNLADASGSRFLRVSLSLVVDSDEDAKTLAESAVVKARIRSEILELLSQQTADALITPEGKTALKKAIAERVAHAGTEVKITDVLFSEFVVQF